ncbi:MAG: thiolase family protein [Microbacteriaceae bacterium]
MPSAVLIDAVRTPSGRGKPGGQLSGVHPVDLLATTLSALVERTGIDPARIDDVIGGCLSQVGAQAVNITRSAVLGAGFPETVPATTIDRQCGSSQQAATFAAQGVMAGAYDAVIACGVERMSSNPINYATLGEDHLGSRVAERYPEGLVGQGVSAELVAARWSLSREELDAFAARSHRLATAAAESGAFARDLIEVTTPDGTATRDETVRPGTTEEGLAGLAPAFRDEAMAERFPEIRWSITAGNSSPLTDGASAVLIMSEDAAAKAGLTPRARFHHFSVVGTDPVEMLTGIIPATRRILERSGMSLDDIDVYEINEAFASVPLAWQKEFGTDPERLNPLGGAIALGHPLGASGTRLLTTMVTALERSGGRFGLQVMCEGAGMANATIVERIGDAR